MLNYDLTRLIFILTIIMEIRMLLNLFKICSLISEVGTEKHDTLLLIISILMLYSQHFL